MASKKAKWSNCVHSHISDTQGVRLAHKSSSKFFLSTKCKLAIFYVFGGKASEQESLRWAYYLTLKCEAGCEYKTIVCWYPGTGSRTPSVDSLLVVKYDQSFH